MIDDFALRTDPAPTRRPAGRTRLGPGEIAAALARCTAELTTAGRTAVAAVLARECVEVHRELAAGSPDQVPGFAAALNDLAVRLAALGLWEQARGPALEAVALLRHDRAGRRRPGPVIALAEAVHNLATISAHLDDGAAAGLAAEAVRLWRAARPGGADRCGLARSLRTLSYVLARDGDVTGALAAVDEAVALLRPAAAGGGPDRAELAAALDARASRLAEADRLGEAVAAAQESVALWRAATSGQDGAPARHDLACALHNLAIHLDEARRVDEAVAAASEAVALLRGPAGGGAPAPRPDLAAAAHTLSVRLLHADRPEEAYAAARESVEIYRALDRRWPGSRAAELAAANRQLAHVRGRTSDRRTGRF